MFNYIIDKDTKMKMLDINNAEELYNLTNSCRSHLRKWLPWVDGTKSVEDTKAFIEMTKRQFASNNGFQAGIWYKETLAGIIGYHNIDWAHKSVSIGYWLADKYEGKGIMTKAAKVFTEYALVELNLNRVEIRCAEKNYKSRAIPERLNFTNEGMVREVEWLYDHYVSHIIYGMLSSQWKREIYIKLE